MKFSSRYESEKKIQTADLRDSWAVILLDDYVYYLPLTHVRVCVYFRFELGTVEHGTMKKKVS